MAFRGTASPWGCSLQAVGRGAEHTACGCRRRCWRQAERWSWGGKSWSLAEPLCDGAASVVRAAQLRDLSVMGGGAGGLSMAVFPGTRGRGAAWLV